MQANILDFKQALEVNTSKIKNNKKIKANDFSEKLNSVNKNNESIKKQLEKNDQNIKSTQKKNTKLTDQDKNVKIEDFEKEEESLIEETQKNNEIPYGNIMNFLNFEKIEENPQVEIKKLDTIIEMDFITDGNLEMENELVLEENHESINLKSSEINTEKAKGNILDDLLVKNSIELEEKEIRPELITEKTNKKEIIAEANEFEETSIGQEENTLNVKGNSSEKTKEEFQDESRKKETYTNEKYQLVKSSVSEESVDGTSESFGSIIKNGLEFSTDNIIDPEIPQVEAKEVIKQIVDQVKFDLSESKNEIKLTLKPEALGEMTMNIELAKDGIIAKIMVDNYKTKEVIESNIFQLKEGIKDTGLEIKTFEVFVGNGSDFDQHESNQFNFNQNNKKLKIKNQNNNKNNFIEAYEEGTVSKNNNLDGINLNGGLNLFA